MPRKKQQKIGARKYRNYTEQALQTAVKACNEGMSSREAEKLYNIPRRTLLNKVNKVHTKSVGHPTCLTSDEEESIVKHVMVCADWGMPLDTLDLRCIVKEYLDSRGKTLKNFNDNLPGKEWCNSFLERHKTKLTKRLCQNIKQSRAGVGAEIITNYFDNLKQAIEGVDASQILNYDETNFSDCPGTKKMLFRRGIKYPERIMNSTKGAISVMFAGSADGVLLPPYVLYRSSKLWSTWCENGPIGTRYSRTDSGWFDSTTFEDWFKHVVIPWAKKKSGPKLVLGDNLSSHLNENVIAECSKYNIRFAFLPANTTHLTQPLDVCFFRPMKQAWRKILERYKTKNPSSSTLEKSQFPTLLKSLLATVTFDGANDKRSQSLISGFKATGICPFDPNKVLEKIPSTMPSTSHAAEDPNQSISNAVLSFLQDSRYKESTPRKRKKRRVEAGQSVTSEMLKQLTDEKLSKRSTQHKKTRKVKVVEMSVPVVASIDSEEKSSVVSISEDVIATDSEVNSSSLMKPTKENMKVSDWVVVEYCAASTSKASNNAKLYAGQVTKKISSSVYEVKFLRPPFANDCEVYSWPLKDDQIYIDFEQIIHMLPEPRFDRRDKVIFPL